MTHDVRRCFARVSGEDGAYVSSSRMDVVASFVFRFDLPSHAVSTIIGFVSIGTGVPATVFSTVLVSRRTQAKGTSAI